MLYDLRRRIRYRSAKNVKNSSQKTLELILHWVKRARGRPILTLRILLALFFVECSFACGSFLLKTKIWCVAQNITVVVINDHKGMKKVSTISRNFQLLTTLCKNIYFYCHIFQKFKSDLKQNGTQKSISFSGSVIYGLYCSVIYFVSRFSQSWYTNVYGNMCKCFFSCVAFCLRSNGHFKS